MKQKTNQLSTEEQLLQARERGLQEAAQVEAMKAHGKVLEMDTFSWISPQIDTLASVIGSFPFPVQWVANHDLVKLCLHHYPELADDLRSVIIHDRAILDIDRDLLHLIPNIACIEGITEALELLKSMRLPKSVFLFTGEKAEKDRDLLNIFIEINR